MGDDEDAVGNCFHDSSGMNRKKAFNRKGREGFAKNTKKILSELCDCFAVKGFSPA
jgi:hypothetical protein